MQENSFGEKALLDRKSTTNARPLMPHSEWSQALRGFLLLAVFAVSALAVGCFESKVVTSKVLPRDASRSAADMNGVFYALPRTVVKVDVPVVRVDKEPGQFVKFTPCFFPGLVEGNGYIKTSTTEFKIAADKIKFDTTFVPDTEEIYMIKTRGGMFETRNLEMELTESGVLVKASADVTNEAIDIVTGGIKTSVGLLAKASGAGLFSEDAFSNFRNSLTREQRVCWDPIEAAYRKERAAAEMRLNSASTSPAPAASPTPRSLLRSRRNSLPATAPASSATPTPSATPPLTPTAAQIAEREQQIEANMNPAILKDYEDFKKAKEAFDFIAALETQRLGLLTPDDIPSDTLKMKLEELDKAIKSYREAYFLGTTTPLTWNTSIYRLNPELPASPGAGGRMSLPLFTMSKTNGVCEVLANNAPYNQGVVFDSRFRIEPCTGERISLEIELGENGEGAPGGRQFSEKVASAKLKQEGKRGFYYRIPGRAIAFVMQARAEGRPKELGRAPLSIAQFGKVVSLPASTGGRKTKYTLALYEASGGLKNFSMGSSALIQQKNLDDLGEAASTAIEAKGERKKAKAPADELQQLERQRKILEERKKIRDLERELDETNNSNEAPSP